MTEPDSPSNPGAFAAVTPHGRGPAAYDLQAPMADAAVGSAFDAANAAGGNGVLFPMSERIHQAQTLIQSPQGFGLNGYSIDAGASAGWPTDVAPTDDPNNGGYGGA
jgi:hypothetical protein